MHTVWTDARCQQTHTHRHTQTCTHTAIKQIHNKTSLKQHTHTHVYIKMNRKRQKVWSCVVEPSYCIRLLGGSFEATIKRLGLQSTGRISAPKANWGGGDKKATWNNISTQHTANQCVQTHTHTHSHPSIPTYIHIGEQLTIKWGWL